MIQDHVYVSAPLTVWGAPSAVIEWAQVRPFQPLLGQDAQMAEFVEALRTYRETEIRFLPAPEIFSFLPASKALLPRIPKAGSLHVRFGTPRRPRLLKGALNIVVLAEDTSVPLHCGNHPFAAGAALPSGVAGALVCERSLPVPSRIDGSAVPSLMLAPCLASPGFGEMADGEHRPCTVIQPCDRMDRSAWCRWGSDYNRSDSAPPPLDQRTTVLLPWNLAAPGSLIPDVLRKASLLIAQGRFPLSVVVMPYNDVPGAIDAIMRVAGSCADAIGDADQSGIRFFRATSLAESRSFAARCREAWIDQLDPEWHGTMQRLGALGLRNRIIACQDTRPDIAATTEIHDADESITFWSPPRDGLLFWRARVASLRTLQELAESIARGAAGPANRSTPKSMACNPGPSIDEMWRFVSSLPAPDAGGP